MKITKEVNIICILRISNNFHNSSDIHCKKMLIKQLKLIKYFNKMRISFVLIALNDQRQLQIHHSDVLLSNMSERKC